MAVLSDDLMAPDVIADPHAYYAELREHDPVHWNERWGGWILTRYDDVVAVLRDQKGFSSDRMAFLARELTRDERARYKPLFQILSRWMVFRDPPGHAQLRILLNKRFTPTAVERYRERVRSIVASCLTMFEGRSEMEIVRDFAYQIPMSVILDLMDIHEVDRDDVKIWSEQLGAFFFIRADEPRRREMACEGIISMVEMLMPVIARRRKDRGEDLISLLLGAEDRGEIDKDDVLATCVLLIFGGHETTMNLIANATLALARHPETWEQLHEQPALLPTAVEEFLRYDGSVKATVRWAREDVRIGDQVIHAGDRLLLALSAANRDPEQFDDPDALDITRTPNAHVAFAHGIHVCIGASLARLEVEEAIGGLTRRMHCVALLDDELAYHPTVVGRALRSLRVSLPWRDERE